MKDFWRKNKVVVVLVVILIGCFIAIAFVAARYFISTNRSIYGDRLQDIDKNKFEKDKQDEFINEIKKNESVISATLKTKGRIVYVTVKFDSKIDLLSAKAVVENSFVVLTESLLEYYDFNVTMSQEESEDNKEAGFIIMGARNANGNGVSWANNTPIEVEESEKQ